MPTLAATQRLLRRLITAPEGVAATLAADADRGGDLRGALTATIRGSGALDPVQRLDIYANMYFFRLLDVLKEDYPACAATAGAVSFHNLATDYLLTHPPAHFSIRYAGRHLPEFVAAHAVLLDHPALGDLAALERALGDAFDAPDRAPLTAADLSSLPPERWAGMRLELHPSVRLLRTRWQIDELRARVDRGEAPGDAVAGVEELCVWRQAMVVRRRRLQGLEFEALAALRGGACFADTCAAAAGGEAAGAAAQRVTSWLAGWLACGWIMAARPVPEVE